MTYTEKDWDAAVEEMAARFEAAFDDEVFA